MNPAESSLLPRVLLGAAAGAAVGLGASSAAAAPVAFDPLDVTVAYTGNAATSSIFFDPQTGYAGILQSEGVSGLNANFRLYLNGSAAKVTNVSLSNGSQTSQAVYNSNSYAPRFSAGTGINGGSGTFVNNLTVNLHDSNAAVTYPWNPGDRGYLALGITANAATGGTAAVGTQLYGWAEVSYNADQSVTIYRLGYDNAGGTSFAGAVPEPSSLSAAAALGAVGLLAYRRRRRAEVASAVDGLAA